MIFDQCCWHRLVIKYYLSIENYLTYSLLWRCKTLLHLDLYKDDEQYNSNYSSIAIHHQQYDEHQTSNSVANLYFIYQKIDYLARHCIPHSLVARVDRTAVQGQKFKPSNEQTFCCCAHLF